MKNTYSFGNGFFLCVQKTFLFLYFHHIEQSRVKLNNIFLLIQLGLQTYVVGFLFCIVPVGGSVWIIARVYYCSYKIIFFVPIYLLVRSANMTYYVVLQVCGDEASGFHYGVDSCEGCKVTLFFLLFVPPFGTSR